jgi:hypothetical protein
MASKLHRSSSSAGGGARLAGLFGIHVTPASGPAAERQGKKVEGPKAPAGGG